MGAVHELSSESDRFASIISLNGIALLPSAIGELPRTDRRQLQVFRKHQVLHTLRLCLQERFVGGVILMRDVARPLLPEKVVLLGLDLLVPHLKTGGPPTLEKCAARMSYGETLEAHGHFVQAAKLYKQCLDEDEANPGVVASPAVVTTWYGIALRKSGDNAGAIVQYEKALRLLEQGCRCELDTPSYRESLRLHTLHLLLVPTPLKECRPIWKEMFRDVLRAEEGRNANETFFFRREGADGDWLESSLGRRWGVVEYSEEGNVRYRVARLPDRVGPFVSRFSAGAVLSTGADGGFTLMEPHTPANAEPAPYTGEQPFIGATPSNEESWKRAGAAGAAKLPKLVEKCGSCGTLATGMKFCSRCKAVSYCSVTCQQAAWREHKRTCTAAAASAAE